MLEGICGVDLADEWQGVTRVLTTAGPTRWQMMAGIENGAVAGCLSFPISVDMPDLVMSIRQFRMGHHN